MLWLENQFKWQMRRINDIGALMDQKLPGLPDHHVLVVNTNHALVEGLIKLKSGSIIVNSAANSPSEGLSIDLARHLYELAKLSVGGIPPTELAAFQTRATELMGKLLVCVPSSILSGVLYYMKRVH